MLVQLELTQEGSYMFTTLKVCLQDIRLHFTCVLSFQSHESRGCLSLLLLSRLPGCVCVCENVQQHRLYWFTAQRAQRRAENHLEGANEGVAEQEAGGEKVVVKPEAVRECGRRGSNRCLTGWQARPKSGRTDSV